MDRFGFHPQSYLKQSSDANDGFVGFMLDQTQGFTHAGVERLNDSIRTYVWAILGAQDQERTPILGSGTAFTAQKRFLTNIAAAIQQAEETPVTKYQSVLQYARGKLDFVIGEQLYMCPSDMTLTLLSAHISGYNNAILVGTKDMSPGQNNGLNAEKLPLTQTVSTDRPSIVASQQDDAKPMQTADAPQAASSDHENAKTLLIVAAIGAGVIYYLVAR